MMSCDQRMQMRRPHMAHMDMDMDMDMEHMDMDMDMDMDTEMEPEGRWCCVRDTLCLWPLLASAWPLSSLGTRAAFRCKSSLQ